MAAVSLNFCRITICTCKLSGGKHRFCSILFHQPLLTKTNTKNWYCVLIHRGLFLV